MRLTRITTASGDQGTTGLADGSRVPKTSRRVATIGEVDELNSLVGLVGALIDDAEMRSLLRGIQNRLFDLGGELALPGREVLAAEAVAFLEERITAINEHLPPLREFVLPGGSVAAAQCHHARSVCRRAERVLLRLAEAEAVNPHSLVFMNRLSDLLFVLARQLARRGGGEEILWERSDA